MSRVEVDQTRTVPSFEEDARRGDSAFLQRRDVREIQSARMLSTYKCIGSHARDVTHFECPFNASPIGFPVFGSHRRTYQRGSGSVCAPRCMEKRRT